MAGWDLYSGICLLWASWPGSVQLKGRVAFDCRGGAIRDGACTNISAAEYRRVTDQGDDSMRVSREEWHCALVREATKAEKQPGSRNNSSCESTGAASQLGLGDKSRDITFLKAQPPRCRHDDQSLR